MKIGIVGAGTMGIGIAQAFALNEGFEVLLCDVRKELAQSGVDRMGENLQKAVKRGKIKPAEAKQTLARVTAGTKANLDGVALVVEAAIEKMEAKRDLFRELQGVCPQDCIFATNTSSLSITALSRGLDRAVVGMHFFNPAETMKLVEVTAGMNTPVQSVAAVKKIATDIGKVPIEAQESAGFVVNRILVPMINEAVGVLADGVSTAEDIDTALKLGANHPMGPLAVGDLVGLDICLAIMEVMQSETGDDKYRPHPLLRKMVRGGRLGRKTGRGFFVYDENTAE